MGKGFEDLDVWRNARAFVKEIYTFTAGKRFDKDWALRDQIRRAAISIMANIAEGSERGSNVEYSRFLDFSIASAAEVKSHLYVALDTGYQSEEQFTTMLRQVETISRQLKGLKRFLRSTQPRPRNTQQPIIGNQKPASSNQ